MTSSRSTRIAIGALTLVYLALAISTAWMDSITGDEVSHLPAGYSYVATGDFRMNVQHPPLVKILAGIPLLALDLRPVEEIEGWKESREWDFGRNFLTDNTQSVQLITFTGRLPMILVGLFLGIVMFLWSRELWGERTAILVFFLFTFSPNLLAHTRLVTTDVGIAAFTVATVAALWKFSETHRIEWALAASVMLGCALLTKYSGLVTLVIVFTLLAADWLSSKLPLSPWGEGAGVRGTGISNDSPLDQNQPLHTLTDEAGTLGAPSGAEARRSSKPSLFLYAGVAVLFIVIPSFMIAGLFDPPRGLAAYYQGFNRVFADFNPYWEAYLWGEWSKDGFWYYYLLAQIWKTPIPTLLLFGSSLFLIDWKDRSALRNWMFVLAPYAAFHAAGMQNDANIGIRHVMPIFPFMMIGAGASIRWLIDRGRAARGLLFALFVWYAAGTLSVFPHFIPYFNELAGGVEGGVRYLDDSNIQWGENFFYLREYRTKHPADESYLEAFTGLDPKFFGVDVPRMSLRDVMWPREGATYYIGASILRRSSLSVQVPTVRFEWIERGYEPVDRVGSIFVYRFTTDPLKTDAQYVPREIWYRDALAQLGRILAASPEFGEARQLTAEIYSDRGAHENIMGHSEEAVAFHFEATRVAPAQDLKRSVYRARFAEALIRLRLSIAPESTPFLGQPPDYLRALSFLNSGRTGEAVVALTRTVAQYPSFIPARVTLRHLLEESGFPRLAIDVTELENREEEESN